MRDARRLRYAHQCRKVTGLMTLACFSVLSGCGYKAADAEDLDARKGEIVGVLTDSKGKAHPDATVKLLQANGTTALSSNNMDSDGRFSLWPPGPGTYNIIGVFGETEKAIKQNVVIGEDLAGVNAGNIEGQSVSILSVRVSTPAGIDPAGVKIEILGTDSSASTIAEGLGAVAGVPAGAYSVRFSGNGLTDLVMDNIVLPAGGTTTLDGVTLE